MIAPRRVTLRTSWIQEDGSGSQDGVKTGPGKGSLCPGCGVPLKRTGSGSMSCWFCEKEFDIDPSDLKEELKKGTGKEEPKWGRPASELEEDEEVFSPDGKKQEDIYDFEIEMNNGEEEEEKVEEWGGHQEMEEDIEFDEDEEGEEEEIEEEEWKIDSEEVTEEEEEEEIEEEEWKIDSEEV
ncbi:MAG: hypothetical protein JXA22_08410, partial [Candidatus Thermoplasmatota archaeon]|nr:hypothetical protein [Candidatus Thermoplasmatota archaeon]